MKTPAEVVIEFFGIRPLARQLGKHHTTIVRWRQRGGTIPSKHHKNILELSKGELTADDLVHGR